MSEKLETASVLAFERKLDPSDALLYYGLWEGRENHTGWNPVRIREKSVRGTISNRLKGEKNQDPLKLNASIESPNLQTIDVATLPEGSDTLKVRFSLRVLSGIGTPSACNSPEYKQRVTEIVQTYMKSYGLSELAYRYAFNLANGRFLWRNRLGAERVEIRIKHIVDGYPRKSWAFDGLSLSLRKFDSPTLPEGSDTLKVRFSLRVLSGIGTPSPGPIRTKASTSSKICRDPDSPSSTKEANSLNGASICVGESNLRNDRDNPSKAHDFLG